MKKLNLIYILCLFLIPKALLHAQADTLHTAKGLLNIHPIHHATMSLNWNDKIIYVDPTGGADAFSGIADPDMVLITHAHGDHLSPETLEAINTQNAVMIMPQSVANKLKKSYGRKRIILKNGNEIENSGINIRAVPMYNLPPSDDAYHPKGWGNGYVLTLANKKVYISGDTEGTPEMRSLKNIDLAFVCMNLPYTMDVQQAANAVLDFKPRVVYPYHYRGQDIQKFKQLVNAKNDDIEVRLRDWYKEK